MDSILFKNLKYYACYQTLFVIIFIIMSSLGAFFHFLLDHEISIVESWLHNNHWEILITSKLISLFLLSRWFKIRLYELKTVRQLLKELITWPEHRALVISTFILVGYLVIGRPVYTGISGSWYHYLASFGGIFLYFGIEFIVIAYLDDVLNPKERPSYFWLRLGFIILFAASFRLTIPDYYKLLPFVIFCFSTLIFLSGPHFKRWSNVLCFLTLFVAPMAAVFGMDPVWGDDFSPFKINSKLELSFLAVIWMISFSYYKYRDQIIYGANRLYR